MTNSKKNEFLKKVFSDKVFFEAEILEIFSNSDRIEVIEILAKRIIGTLLRKELNFIYMKDLKKFSFSSILNSMFQEISNEWVSYVVENLKINEKKAITIIQEKEHTLFLLTLVKEYFRHYKIYFLQDIADSFIGLIKKTETGVQAPPLVSQILLSDFVKNDNVVVVENYDKLWRKIRYAQASKDSQLKKLQIRINRTEEGKEKEKMKYSQEILLEKPLALLDDTLLTLRSTMVKYMMNMKV